MRYLLSLILLVFSCHTMANEQPKNIVDYFKLLPEKYFQNAKERDEILETKHSSSTIVDAKNGYIHIDRDVVPSFTVALFKQADKNDLIAVYGYSSQNNLTFYHYTTTEGWVDVTQAVLPEDIIQLLQTKQEANDDLEGNYDIAYLAELPRHGTTIVIKDSADHKVYELTWTKKDFKAKKLK